MSNGSKRGRKAGGKNRNKIPKTSKLMKTCMQALDLHLENLYTVLNSETGDKDGEVSLKNKLDAGKEVRGLATEVFGEELKAGASLVVDQEGESNPHRTQLTQAQIESLEKKADPAPPASHDKSKTPVVSLIERFKEA